MGKGSHGSQMIGNSHSHDSDYPSESWNLYSHIDKEETVAFNIKEKNVVQIFKPSVKKLEDFPVITSGCDQEILISISFLNPVFVKELCIIGGGNIKNHPKRVRCFPNKMLQDFANLPDIKSDLHLDLPINKNGDITFRTNLKFQQLTSLSLYFYENHNENNDTPTIIKYIGFKGEHTHDKRKAVSTNYELLGAHSKLKNNIEKINTKSII